jgi:hypothetical protein
MVDLFCCKLLLQVSIGFKSLAELLAIERKKAMGGGVMTLREYLVTLRGNHWWIIVGDTLLAAFNNQELAIDSALQMASADRSDAKSAVVLLEEDGTTVQLCGGRETHLQLNHGR